MEGLLQGKVAVVTGGATGIGEAICKLFARHGAQVVVNGLPGDPVDEVVAEIAADGGAAFGITADVGTEAGAKSLLDGTLERHRRLDVLVLNAGLWPELLELQEFPLERFEELIHSNIRGVYYPAREAVSALRASQGVLLTAGSEAGTIGNAKLVPYSSTKGWVAAFTRAFAAENAKHGVRANVVAPGPIDTEMTRPSKGHMTMKMAFLSVESVPLGRRGTPEEVANVYLFLASDLASYVTGAVVPVDGGVTASTGFSGLEAKRDVKQAPEGTLDLQHQHEGRGTLEP